MFEAGASVPYLMSQVGHADSATTLEVYSQVLSVASVGRSARHDRLMGDAVPPNLRAEPAR